MSEKTDVWQGTLALMALKTLEALGPLHGYGIARRIEQISENKLAINYGTIYPSLLKLEQEGYIASEWRASDNNRRAKYYKLTRAGRKRLAKETRKWETTTAMLKPGVSLSAAQADMDVIARQLAAQYPEDKGFGAHLTPMRESVAGSFRTPLLILLGALGFVLLLACVNIANLQLVRLEARRRELAVRSALGASARRLLSQMATESLLLVAAAGVLGFCLAPIGVKLLLWLVPPEQIPWLKVKTDILVLLVSFGATAMTALFSGLAPAFKAARIDVIGALGAARATGAGLSRRWRVAFVIAQLALAVLPLSAAALLVNSFARLSRVEPGFQVDNRLTLSYFAPVLRAKDAAAVAQLAERMSEELRRVPGIKAAGGVHYLPFSPAVGWGQAVSRARWPRSANRSLASTPIRRSRTSPRWRSV
jgi:putative ABC transport system permease protein